MDLIFQQRPYYMNLQKYNKHRVDSNCENLPNL